MNIAIANRLMELRRRRGYSQEELGEKIGVSRLAVSKWERAESSPDIDNIIALSKLYGISIDELLDSEKPVEETNFSPEEPLQAEVVDKKEEVDEDDEDDEDDGGDKIVDIDIPGFKMSLDRLEKLKKLDDLDRLDDMLDLDDDDLKNLKIDGDEVTIEKNGVKLRISGNAVFVDSKGRKVHIGGDKD